MPTYDWTCDKCKKDFITICGISEYTGRSDCPKCKTKARRVIKFTGTQFIGARVENAEWNPAFGKVIKNSKHRKEEAKARGWVEVGNESPKTVHKEMSDKFRDNMSWDKVKI